MVKLFDKNNNSILPKQNSYLPIILWLFPLLLIDIGWYFLTVIIDFRWVENEWKEQSNQEVEYLSSASDFNHCVGKIVGDFQNKFKSDVNSLNRLSGIDSEKILKDRVQSCSNRIFRPPFAKHTLFVFHHYANTKKNELIFSNIDNVLGKTALGKAFEYLVRVNLPDSEYKDKEKIYGEKYTKAFLGGDTEPEVMAITQRGKVTYSIYQFKPHFFIWDYFKEENSEDIFGYFLLIENNEEAESSSRLIALRDYLKSGSNGAFIPLFPGYGGVVTTEEFAKMPEYKTVTRKWTPKTLKDLSNWQLKNTETLFEDTKVGNYQAFFHLTNGQSHAAVLLKPLLEKPRVPFWLLLFNIFIISIIILLLVRGFLLGIWPKTSLRFRFITTYFLAACMPLGLLIIASQGYISEYRHSEIYNDQSRLRQCINQFEIRKTQKQEEYKTAFQEIKNDSIFQECIRRLDEVNNVEPRGFPPEAEAVLDRALEILSKDGRSLPILSLTFLDERGNYFSNYGSNRKHRTFKIYDDGKEYFDKNIEFKPEFFKDDDVLNIKNTNEKSIEVVMYSFLQPMRDKILENAPRTKKWTKEFVPTFVQGMALGGFKSARGHGHGKSLTEEMTNHRNLSISRLVGDKIVSNIYDNIFIDGIPRFTIYMSWDVSKLDKESFESSLNYFALKEPKFIFYPYNLTTLNDERWDGLELDRHRRDFEELSKHIAEQANSSKNNIFYHENNTTVIAVPSSKYKDTIIVGAVSHQYLALPIFKRVFVCITIIIFAMLTLLFCIYYSTKIFIKPIGKLKEVLDKVAEGNLDIEIKSNSKDEFGTMCHEFSEMTKELSERNKLATLISDHAVEALSKHEEGSEVISDVETFKGTVLVSDIRNFTGMCEKNNPEQITDLLNEHFALMTKIFSLNGGRIYKYIGDAVEVVFVDNDDREKTSVERAFTAAIEMLDCLKKINSKRKQEGQFEYKIGVGLCYSTMSSGSIGSLETRLDYAILGNALKNAAKLENFSKLTPEFPLVVDFNFINEFKNVFNNINFTLLNTEECLDGYRVDNACLDDVLALMNKSIRKVNIDNINDNSNSLIDTSKELIETYEIEEHISFWGKLIPGLLFTIIFSLLLSGGLYFNESSEIKIKKDEKKFNNQRILEQFRCESYGKAAFDIKCRVFAKALQDKINELNKNENISDEIIIKTLNDCYKSNKDIAGLGFNMVFIREGDSLEYKNYLDDYASFFNKIPVYSIAKTGYTNEEVKKICDSYKIIFVCDIAENLEKESQKNNLKNELLNYMKNNIGEPSREIFGDKITSSLLKNDITNTSAEVTMRDEDYLLYSLRFFDKSKKHIGYLLLSMSNENAYNSIPFILNSFSKNHENVILRKFNSDECYYSENIPIFLKDKISQIVEKYNNSDKEIKFKALTDYLESLSDTAFDISDIRFDRKITINGKDYEIYFLELNDQNNLLRFFKYIIVCIISILLFWFLLNVVNGTSRINFSIPAKLWLTLLIVAVIPVITVFFVSSLFLNEYLSVKKSQKRGEMQRFMGYFENKKEFSYPLIWNEIKTHNHSETLNNCIKILNNKENSVDVRKKAMECLRNYFDELIANSRNMVKDNAFTKNIMSCRINDVSLSGVGGWNFCASDGKEKDSIENSEFDLKKLEKMRKESNKSQGLSTVSYINEDSKEQDNIFGLMLKLIVRFLLNRQTNKNTSIDQKSLGKDTANEIVLSTSFDVIRAFFGDDTFIKISHGIDIPIIFNIGFGRFGIMISSLPNSEKPEAVLVWMVIIDTFDYLDKVSDKVETDLKVFVAESFNYGDVADEKDNNLRIPLGEFTSWMTNTLLPVSTNIELEDGNNLVECAPALNQFNSMFVLLSPEQAIIKEVNNFAYAFYALLAISLSIIVFTTKNIADDIINPVNALITGIKEVNKENFLFRINTDRSDELGALCLSFDKMIKGLDEKRMMSHMLSNTARMVTLNEGNVFSGKTDAVLLYIGIPDFSNIMLNYRDYEIFSLLKTQTAIIAGIIMEEGGEVDKIMGEKMLSVFRANDDKLEVALAAYRVAKRILELEKNNSLSFPISIGLNYGNVINGFLGVGNKRDFTVIGDPVNVAARIESLAEKLVVNRCLISETFYKLVNKSIVAKAYGEVELKGKSQPMKVYQLS